MLVNKYLFMGIVFLVMLGLIALGFSYLWAGVITFISVFIGYVIISYSKNKKRIDLLEKDLDPNKFIESVNNQLKISGRNQQTATFLNIDKAAGLIALGEFNKAKDLLLSLNHLYLPSKNGILAIYYINLVGCYYELGEIDLAEGLFNKELNELPSYNKRINLALEFLKAERLFFIEDYKNSKDALESLLKTEQNKFIYLNILYRLAQIDYKLGNDTLGYDKYKKVAMEGNELYIAKKAKEFIN